jgi:hypothetical protein
MSVCFILFTFPLFNFGASASFQYKHVGDFLPYGYVLAIPGTFLAALLLIRWKNIVLIPILIILASWQWYVIVIDKATFAYYDDDRRALAGAAFLLEQRPDLLQKDKRTLLVEDSARSVGNYARGQNGVLSISADAPSMVAEKNRIRPVTGVLGEFFQYYNAERILFVDWLMLSSEVFQPGLDSISSDFFRRLSQDPQIDWTACLQDSHGRKLWIGEVKSNGTPLENAPVYDVDPFADIYQQKYNRISFLKRNVRNILHY